MQAFARGSGSDGIADAAKRSASAMESVASVLLGGGGAAAGAARGGAAAPAAAPAASGESAGERKWQRQKELLAMMVDYQNNNKEEQMHGMIQNTFMKLGTQILDDEGPDADDAQISCLFYLIV
ncbi:unnamed protein product [Ectocarpus sp. 4 AP-2014]